MSLVAGGACTTPNETHTNMASWIEDGHRGERPSILGICRDSAGLGYYCVYSDEDHELSVNSLDGGANPTVDHVQFRNWGMAGGAHFGHQLTHLGVCGRSDGGTQDVWYCQRDNRLCIDRLS